ncbi:MAG TPA: hypothetical protein VMH36_06720 [Alphaproteobacteria bacterium]|nr:hypothetical protein [Alphaproteobacteria bacterium]
MLALRATLSGALFATLLVGCAQPDLVAQRAADDDLKCAGYGITAADPGYAQCRYVFARQRGQQQQNAMNALMLHGAYLPNQAPFGEPAPGAVAVMRPTLTSCWPTVAGWNCYTQYQ